MEVGNGAKPPSFLKGNLQRSGRPKIILPFFSPFSLQSSGPLREPEKNRCGFKGESKGERLLNRARKLNMKLECMAMEGRRLAHKISVEAVKTAREAVRVLKIMILLHSAKDFPSVLKLYGAEDSSVAD